jgi:hypothetical protein
MEAGDSQVFHYGDDGSRYRIDLLAIDRVVKKRTQTG